MTATQTTRKTITNITITIDGEDDHGYAVEMFHSVQGIGFTADVVTVAAMANTELSQINSFRAENDLPACTRVDLVVTFDDDLVIEATAE